MSLLKNIPLILSRSQALYTLFIKWPFFKKKFSKEKKYVYAVMYVFKSKENNKNLIIFSELGT